MSAAGLTALLRVVPASAVRAGREHAVALYLGLLIVAVIVFGGPNAMRASDVTQLARLHAGPRLVLWAAWLTAALPLSRAVLVMPPLFGLRALPVARWHHLCAHLVPLLAAQGPWLLLWGRGEGVGSGLAMAATAAAAEALWVARSRRPLDLIAAAALGAVVAGGVTGGVVLSIAAPSLAVALAAAFRRAPELAAQPGPTHLRAPRPLVLGAVYLRALWRRERALGLRAVILALCGGGAAAAALGSNAVVDPRAAAKVTLAVLAPPLCIAATGLAAAVLRAERRDEGLWAALGLSPQLATVGALEAIAGPALGLGALGGLVAMRLAARWTGPLALVAPAAWSLALAAAALAVGRLAPRALRPPGAPSSLWVARRAERAARRAELLGVLLPMMAVAGAFTVGAALAGPPAVMALLPVALLAAVLAPGPTPRPARRVMA